MTKYRDEIRSEGERLDLCLSWKNSVIYESVFSFSRGSVRMEIDQMISFALGPKKLIVGEKQVNNKKTTDAYSHCY